MCVLFAQLSGAFKYDLFEGNCPKVWDVILRLTCQRCYTIAVEMGNESVVTGQDREYDFNITFYCEHEKKITNTDKPVQSHVHVYHYSGLNN